MKSIFKYIKHPFFWTSLLILFVVLSCGIGLGPGKPGPGTTSAPPFIPDGITRILLDLENKYLVSGYTNSDQDFTVGKFFSNGSLDTSFAGSGTEAFNLFGTDHHHDSTIDLENRILIAGVSPLNTEHVVARFTSNGFLDSSFSSDGKFSAVLEGVGSAKSVAVQSDGKYIIAGTADKGLSTGYGATLARLHTNGTLDTIFSTDGSLLFTHVPDTVFKKVSITTSGRYLAVGHDEARISLERITLWDGEKFNFLDSGLSSNVFCMALGPDGIYVGGLFSNAGGIATANSIARWDGSTWNAVSNGLSTGALAMTQASNGIYMAGKFSNLDGSGANNIAFWNGSTWSALAGGDLNTEAYVITNASNGGIYVGGSFTQAGVTAVNRIAHWNGTTWNALGSPALTQPIWALAVATSGLYVGGQFTDFAGLAPADNIAFWNGSTWSAVGGGLSATVNGFLVASDGIYVGGSFTNAGGVAEADMIARWNGSTWSAIETGLNNSVVKMALGSNGIYVGGFFSNAGGIAAADSVALWNGSTWSALGTGLANAFHFVIASNGLYIGGNFTTPAAAPTQALIARYLTSGSLDTAFAGTGYQSFSVVAGKEYLNNVHIDTNGKAIAAGNTSTDFLLARFLSNGTFDNTFSSDGKATLDLGGIEVAHQVILYTDGKYLIAGSRNTDGVIARIFSNGALDTSFATNGYRTFDYSSNDSIGSLVLHSDGEIAIGLSGGSDLGVLKISP